MKKIRIPKKLSPEPETAKIPKLPGEEQIVKQEAVVDAPADKGHWVAGGFFLNKKITEVKEEDPELSVKAESPVASSKHPEPNEN